MQTHSDGTITIAVNGEHRRVAGGITLAQLASELGLVPEKVAVERNLEVVPRSTLAQVLVEDGDEIEIVHFVGGGSGAIEAYGMNADLETRSDGSVSRDRALELCRRYHANSGRHYENGEEALAASTFGFARDGDKDFLEISIADAEHIHVTHERRLAKKMLGLFPQSEGAEANISGRAALARLEAIVAAYFDAPETLIAMINEVEDANERQDLDRG
jgi:thiamine biosynthesis protein ThiS